MFGNRKEMLNMVNIFFSIEFTNELTTIIFVAMIVALLWRFAKKKKIRNLILPIIKSLGKYLTKR